MEVPTLDRRRVLPQAGSSVRLPTQAPGVDTAELADATDSASRVLLAAQVRKDQENDAGELAGLSANITDWQTRTLYDPEKGVLNRKGKDAFGIQEEVLPAFDKHVGQVTQAITSPRVRATFERLAQDERSRVTRNLATHEQQQRVVYNDQQTAAMMLAQDNAVGANPLDAEGRLRAITLKQDAVRAKAARDGVAPEVLDQALLASESAVHKAAVVGMVATGSYSEAANYYTANRTRFTDEDARSVAAPVREGQVRALSQDKADEILAKHGAGAGALKAAREIEDADVRKAVEYTVRQTISDANMLRNQAEEQASDRAWDIYEKTGDWRQVPADVWMTVPGPTREAIRNSDERKSTDTAGWQTYYELRSLASSPETAALFLQKNLMVDAFPHMAPQQAKELMDLQAALRAGDAKAQGTTQGFLTMDDHVNNAIIDMGLDPNEKDGAKAQRVVDFKNKANAEVRALEQNTGRRATPDDVKKITDRLTIEQAFERPWYLPDKTVRAFEAPENEVPAAEVPKIKEALLRSGRKATPEAILELYQRKLARGQ